MSKNAIHRPLGLQCLPHPSKIEASLHQSPIIITKNNCLVWSAQFVANNKSLCLPVANYAIECCRLYIKSKVHIGITAKQLFLGQFINEGDHKFLLFSAVLIGTEGTSETLETFTRTFQHRRQLTDSL